MNILIVGEFSAFAHHLKAGFVSLGHDVCVVTHGDGFKKLDGDYDDIKYNIPKDINLFGRTIKKSHILINPFENKSLNDKLKTKHTPDLIIVVNSVFVSASYFQLGVDIGYIKRCKKAGSKVILCSCGADPANHRFYPDLKYYKYAFPGGLSQYSKRDEDKFIKLIELSDIIIPTSYEYYYSINKYLQLYNLTTKCSETIPVPVTELQSDFSSCEGRKIKIFHGVIRSAEKGTPYFVDALKRIEKDFPDKVEIIIDGRMPYNDYLELLVKVDVLLDNTNCYDLGVNSALGLMMGKVVLSGNEPEAEKVMGLGRLPVINAIPDVDYIYNVLVDLIHNPQKIDRIKLESREFAQKHLTAKVIASRYLNLIVKEDK